MSDDVLIEMVSQMSGNLVALKDLQGGLLTEKGLEPAQASPFEGQRLALLASAKFVPFELYLNILYTLQQYGRLMRDQLQSLSLSPTRLFEISACWFQGVGLWVKVEPMQERTNRNTRGFEADEQVSPRMVPRAGQALWELT